MKMNTFKEVRVCELFSNKHVFHTWYILLRPDVDATFTLIDKGCVNGSSDYSVMKQRAIHENSYFLTRRPV